MNLARSSALALATVLAVMAPTAAQAASYHHSDAVHDVVSVNDDNDTVTPAPDRTDGDILTSRLAYGPRRVTLAMTFAALDRPTGLAEHYFSIATSKGKVRSFILVAGKKHPGGSLIKQTGRGKKFTCKRVHWSIGYGARTITLSVPKHCLGKARWVRGAMATIDVDDFQADNPPIFVDDSNTTGFSADRDPRYGPRVYR